ncbi:MAG: YdcH family protein [Rhodospirillales bacterium]|nr:YdcH family protein [Rhodospirillales bacterium]
MTEHDKVSTLQTLHSELKDRIDRESRRPHPDELRVADLKREKLKIKDELASMNAL